MANYFSLLSDRLRFAGEPEKRCEHQSLNYCVIKWNGGGGEGEGGG